MSRIGPVYTPADLRGRGYASAVTAAASAHVLGLGAEEVLLYTDLPGVIGALGRLLGERDINIAGMQVSRNKEGGQALSLLTVDSSVPQDVLDAIRAEIGATVAREVDLQD